MTTNQNSDKIGTSTEAYLILVLLMIVSWGVLNILIIVMFEEEHFYIGTIAFLCLLASIMIKISGNIKNNETGLIMNLFTGAKRAVESGFFFKLPWEDIVNRINLAASISSEITETFQTKDGSVKITFSLMSKAVGPKNGESERTRTVKMINYTKFEDTIKKQQETIAKKVIRERVAKEPSETVKNMKSDDLLKKSDFSNLENDLSAEVTKYAIKDIDYSDEMQKSMSALFRAETVAKITKELIDKGGYSAEEAKERAMYLIDESKWTREVKENKFGLSPELLAIINEILKNFKK